MNRWKKTPMRREREKDEIGNKLKILKLAFYDFQFNIFFFLAAANSLIAYVFFSLANFGTDCMTFYRREMAFDWKQTHYIFAAHGSLFTVTAIIITYIQDDCSVMQSKDLGVDILHNKSPSTRG